ncbi:uncharacterized protein VP01_803g4 [Puccinia sorghi]|uniref:Retrotransposon gag domain-containing protein n=1 Tax=Puccinia sorghi TaxID=27349 RepID=A0A0L6UAD2_9BASI|nr:uncharacterized protein VP01_803g4 [Puccinia sorghi]
MVLAKPQPFNRNCGAVGESFVGQILLHAVTYHDQFPTESSKVAFAVSFMTDYAATWSQPYLMRVFNSEGVVFDEFLDDFSCFFVHNCQQHAEPIRRISTHTLHFWIGRHPTDESLPEWTEGKLPTCCGNEQHRVHLPPDYAGNGPESRPDN